MNHDTMTDDVGDAVDLEPMTIDEALAIGVDWHGIEPCELCAIQHTPVWGHVDFTEDSSLAAALRARKAQVLAAQREAEHGSASEVTNRKES